jgi:tetratricopeptide (TPR) repeat protein
MLGFAWLTIRQAQEAVKNGRLEEAYGLLQQPEAQGHQRSWELLQQVARGFVERAERHMRHDEIAAAWNDLMAAEEVGATDSSTARLRQALTRLGITEVRALLEAGEPGRAGEAITQLQNRGVRQPELQTLDEAARAWNLGREQSKRGEFAQALQTIDRVRRLFPGRHDALEQFLKELEQRHQAFSDLIVQLHEALEQKRWGDVVHLSEKVLAMAPQHEEARRARTRAWKAIEPPTVAEQRLVKVEPAEPPRQRFLLWIDGVGGYLVCLENRVTIGQATPDAFVDIPLYADVSRLHATLTRDSEGYLIEATRGLQVNGRDAERALLQNGDRVTLGQSCQLQFRQPVPVSASARLEITSGHRLQLAVDGVLLMADTLVLGPDANAHVQMPDLAQPIVLFRQKDGLGVRHAGAFQIDGQRCKDRGTLTATSTLSGDDFALAVEPLGTRMGRS